MRSDPKSSNYCHTSDKVLEGAMNMSSPGCASRRGSCFKENVNINKYESPKLAVEPLQMKRKGKGGGYNLRKSLAWDRAFFTEDGVLDPVELSIITGASCQEGLLSVKDDDACNESGDQRKLGKSSSKNFPNVDKRRERDGLSRKDCSSSLEHLMSTSTDSPRVPASADAKARSRSGEFSSSSLKRPANVNVCKSALELKLPKVPCYKPGFSPKGATSRSIMLRASSVKHNHIVQSDADIQRNEGTANSSRSLMNSKNGSKATSQQSAHLSDTNPGYSLIKRPSSVSTSKVLLDRANISVAKIIPGNRRLSSARQTHSSENHDGIATCAAPLPQASCVSASSMHPLHNQTIIKPSGLRMPSPSLSFFSRPKASALHSLTRQKVGTDVFESRRSGNLHFHGGTTPKMDEKITENTAGTVDSRATCMASSRVGTFGLNNIQSEQDSSKNVKLNVFDDSHNLASISNKHSEGSRGSGEIVPKLFEIDDRTDWISQVEKEVQKIQFEVALQGQNYEDVIDDKTLEDDDNYTVKSESCGRKLRNVELLSEQNNACGSENNVSLCEPHKLKSHCDSPILKNGGSIAIQLLEASNQRGPGSSMLQSHRKDSLKIDGHDTYSGRCDLPIDLPSVTGKRTDEEVNGFKYRKDLTTEDGYDNKQSGGSLEIHQASLNAQTESQMKTEYHEKLICHENFHKEANIETFPVSPDMGSGSAVVSSERQWRSSIMAFNYDVEHVDAPSSASIVGSGGRSQKDSTVRSCEIRTLLASNPADNFLPNTDQTDHANSAKIDCCSLSSASQAPKVSEETIPRISDGEPILDNNTGNNLSISTFSSKDSESDAAINVNESGTVPVNCFFGQLEYSALHNDESVRYDLVDGDDGLHSQNCDEMKRIVDGSRKDYESGKRTVYGSNKVYESGDNVCGFIEVYESGNSDASAVEENDKDEGIFSTRKSPLKLESSNDAHETDDQSSVECARKDCSEIEPVETDVSEYIDISSHEFHPKSDNANVEANVAPKNDYHDCPKQKGSIALPKNVVPFSDEWLAAVEAAGEDILTLKSGAVQNSPPEKPVPEPSPWSPVKKKNNHIGPYDCTKYTNNLPSDSN